MKIEQGFVQRQEQRLAILPKMLQSIEVLQCSNLELEAMLQKALSENETLRVKEEGEDLPAKNPASEKNLGELMRTRESRRANQEASDRHQEWMANAPAPSQTLRAFLREQVALLPINEKSRAALYYLVEAVDENGYLNASDEEILQGLGNEFTLEEVRESIRQLQSLEPKGVGGRGAIESLLLQVDHKDVNHAVIHRLLHEFLEDISKNRLPKVAQSLGLSLEQLDELLARIRQLNPRPGSGFAQNDAPVIRPDLMIQKEEEQVAISVEDQFLPRLALERRYEEMSQNRETPSEVRKYLKEKMASARWLIDSIDQRRQTLHRIAELVFRHQVEFLEQGARAIRPLMMKDIAQELSVHVSTVSRAVANKYVQTPMGIYPLRDFFCAATEGETESSRVGVREIIRDMIQAENSASPLSDEEIVERLKAKGIEVARRTVAKYRTELNIPSSWRRKSFQS